MTTQLLQESFMTLCADLADATENRLPRLDGQEAEADHRVAEKSGGRVIPIGAPYDFVEIPYGSTCLTTDSTEEEAPKGGSLRKTTAGRLLTCGSGVRTISPSFIRRTRGVGSPIKLRVYSGSSSPYAASNLSADAASHSARSSSSSRPVNEITTLLPEGAPIGSDSSRCVESTTRASNHGGPPMTS